jgi:hypothetical protein
MISHIQKITKKEITAKQGRKKKSKNKGKSSFIIPPIGNYSK